MGSRLKPLIWLFVKSWKFSLSYGGLITVYLIFQILMNIQYNVGFSLQLIFLIWLFGTGMGIIAMYSEDKTVWKSEIEHILIYAGGAVVYTFVLTCVYLWINFQSLLLQPGGYVIALVVIPAYTALKVVVQIKYAREIKHPTGFILILPLDVILFFLFLSLNTFTLT